MKSWVCPVGSTSTVCDSQILSYRVLLLTESSFPLSLWERVGVRAGDIDGFKYLRSYTFQIRQNVIVEEAQDFDPVGGEKFASCPIGCERMWLEVLTSISFDCKLMLCTIEVQDVWPELVLATELCIANLSIPKDAPELSLGVGRFRPKSANSADPEDARLAGSIV